MDKQHIAALVLRAKKNDQAAWSDLYELSYRSLYFIAVEFMKNKTDAEDALQEAFLKIAKHLDQLEDPERFLAWAKQVTTNTCLNQVRKRRDFTFTELEEKAGLDDMDISLEVEDVSVSFRPEDQMEIKETSRLVREMMDELPDDQRVSLDLLYGSEMSVKEIADSIECSVNTVKSRLRYGRIAIEEKVERLRKEGTKLYTLPLAAIIQILCRREMEAYAAESIPQSILSRLEEEYTYSAAKNQKPERNLTGKGFEDTGKGLTNPLTDMDISNELTEAKIVERKAKNAGNAADTVGTASETYSGGSVNPAKPAVTIIPLFVKILAGVLTVAFVGTMAIFAKNSVTRNSFESAAAETVQPSEGAVLAEENSQERKVETAEELYTAKVENKNPNTVSGYEVPGEYLKADYSYYQQPEISEAVTAPKPEQSVSRNQTERARVDVPETAAPAETAQNNTDNFDEGNENNQTSPGAVVQAQENIQESAASETEAQPDSSVGFRVGIGSEGATVEDWHGNPVSEGSGGVGILQDGTRVIVDANGNVYDLNGNPLPDVEACN